MAVAWQMLPHPSLGQVNRMLVNLGLPARQWLTDRAVVLLALAEIGVWRTVGYTMVLVLAGLAAVPAALCDAAAVEGGRGRVVALLGRRLADAGATTLFVVFVTAANAFRVFGDGRRADAGRTGLRLGHDRLGALPGGFRLLRGGLRLDAHDGGLRHPAGPDGGADRANRLVLSPRLPLRVSITMAAGLGRRRPGPGAGPGRPPLAGPR
jgi:hypothetical protein